MTKRMTDKAFAKLNPEHAANCQNCDWQGHSDDLEPIRDLWERVEEGDTVWAGDCPACGAMAFTVAEVARQDKPRQVDEAAVVMLAVLKTAAKYREKGSILDAMLAAIAQAEAAGLDRAESCPNCGAPRPVHEIGCDHGAKAFAPRAGG